MRTPRRRAVVLAAAVAAASVVPGQAVAGQKDLGVTFMKQQGHNWCWVATARMVASYLRFGKSGADQCTYYKWGKSTGSCPDQPGDFDRDMTRELAVAGTTQPGKVINDRVTYAQLKDDINMGKPVLVRIKWWGGGEAGHVLVVKGYADSGSTGVVQWLDPETGLKKYTYGTLLAGKLPNQVGHTWTHTRIWIGG